MEKDSTENMYLSLKEYKNLAKGVICFMKQKQLLLDEDAVSYIMYCMMFAEKRYNGMGTRVGFRWEIGKYAVRRHIDNIKKKSTKKFTLSLDANHGYNSVSLNERSSMEKLEYAEIVDYIQTCKLLSETERQCIVKHYVENNSREDIAEELGITRQGVHAAITSGLTKLRWKFNE